MDALNAVPPRHPWLDRLIADPGAEVRALTERTASIHPYRRAEPSDAAAALLFGLAADDPAIKAFDHGAHEVLLRYRAAAARNDQGERDRIALAALDLMTVVQRLSPRDTVIDLHRRFLYWNTWAETLVLDRGLDLRREYWRALALTQDIAAEAGSEPRRLLPFWLDICGEAGRHGRYDESYLTVGLLGLRSLPLGEDAANEEAALHGLARWADAQRPAKKLFLREWRVLEGAFPRDPMFWTDLVARVVASIEGKIAHQTDNARRTFVAAAWWRDDVEAVQGAKLESRAAELEPPAREMHEALLADISAKRPFNTVEPRLSALVQRHERYAIRTGDTFYLVRTACNVGMQLLRGGGDVPERRTAKARELARLALRFEGANIFAWALWRDALAAGGHIEAAELVGWETIRRFPEDLQWRNQLASLLAEKLEKPREAEALLRETIRLSIDDKKNGIVAHTQLANIVGRKAERLKEAIEILDAALKIEPDNQISKSMKQRFEGGKISDARTNAARVAGAEVGAELPSNLIASARMRRALFHIRTATDDERAVAQREAEAVLNNDENLGYARYVAAAADMAEPDDRVPAVAFLAAIKKGTAEALRSLSAHVQGLDGVIISLASASRGDEEAARVVKGWIAEPANDLSPRDQSLRAIAGRFLSPLPADFVGDMLAASLDTALAA